MVRGYPEDSMMIPSIATLAPTMHTDHHTDILHVVKTEIPLDKISDLWVGETGMQVELANGVRLSCMWSDRHYAMPKFGQYEIALVGDDGCMPLPGHSDTVIAGASLSEIAWLARYALSL